MLVTFTTTQISALRIAFEAIESLISDVMFVFSADAIRIKDVDKTGKLLISAKFETDKFDTYKFDHTTDMFKVGIATDSIVKAIKSNLSYDILTFEVKSDVGHEVEASITLTSIERKETKKCVLKKANVLSSSDNIATLLYDVECSISPSLLSKYIKDINNVADKVSIGVNVEGLYFKGFIDDKTNERLVVSHQLKHDGVFGMDIVDGSFPSKTVSINSLLLLNRCVNLCPKCLIYLSNNQPLLFIYPLSSMGELKLLFM
jgi:hypothetical protein